MLQTADVHCRPPHVSSTGAIYCAPEDDVSSDSDGRSDSDDDEYLSESLVFNQPGLLLFELLLSTNGIGESSTLAFAL